MKTEIQKISWLRRLFMSWRLLCDHFQNYVTQHITQETTVLKQNLHEREKEIIRLETKLQEKEKHNEDLLSWKKAFQKELDEKQNLLAQKKQEIQTILTEKEVWKESAYKKDIDFEKQETKLRELQSLISAKTQDIQKLDNDIRQKLIPLDKIERTFFGISGNKGVGNLGEMQLEVMLQKFDIDPNLWQKNLQVGDNNVEFAFTSGYDDHKWIPIDSKVLHHQITDEKEIIIDDSYEKTIKTQAEKVSKKYLDKKNTTKYGILVLQNDAIYLALWQQKSFLFSNLFRQYQVYILSPTLFIQFAFSLAEILKVKVQVVEQEQIFRRLNLLVNKIMKYNEHIRDAYLAFHEATVKNWPSITTQTNKLIKLIPHNDNMQKNLLKLEKQDNKCLELIDSYKKD